MVCVKKAGHLPSLLIPRPSSLLIPSKPFDNLSISPKPSYNLSSSLKLLIAYIPPLSILIVDFRAFIYTITLLYFCFNASTLIVIDMLVRISQLLNNPSQGIKGSQGLLLTLIYFSLFYEIYSVGTKERYSKRLLSY